MYVNIYIYIHVHTHTHRYTYISKDKYQSDVLHKRLSRIASIAVILRLSYGPKYQTQMRDAKDIDPILSHENYNLSGLIFH